MNEASSCWDGRCPRVVQPQRLSSFTDWLEVVAWLWCSSLAGTNDHVLAVCCPIPSPEVASYAALTPKEFPGKCLPEDGTVHMAPLIPSPKQVGYGIAGGA